MNLTSITFSEKCAHFSVFCN